MSGEGGPMAAGGFVEIAERDDVLADIGASERGQIARRIGAIVAHFQREASGGVVALSDVELRLALLADDVRGGLHGKAD